MFLQEKLKINKTPTQRKCASCKNSLRDTWQKAMCRTCIGELMEEETSQQYKDLFSSQVLSSVKSMLVQSPAVQTEPQQSPPSPKASTSKSDIGDSGDEGTSTLRSVRDSDEEQEVAEVPDTKSL